MITKLFTYSGDNIDKIYKQIATDIISKGNDINFGDKEEEKFAREIMCTVQIHGKGLRNVLKGKTPKGFGWSGKKVKKLMESFVADAKNPTGFEYTYPELLSRMLGFKKDKFIGNSYAVFDQFEITKNALMIDKINNIMSNRNVGTLYQPGMHQMKDKPCFNWFQIRYTGEGKGSLRLLFRSHDYGDAFWANLSSVGHGFNELVFKPCGVELEEIIVVSASAHVYDNQSDLVENLTGIKWNKEEIPKGVA